MLGGIAFYAGISYFVSGKLRINHLNGLSHCGRCWGCARRKLAFLEAGVSDPTDYEYKEIIRIDKIDLTVSPSSRGLIFPQIPGSKDNVS